MQNYTIVTALVDTNVLVYCVDPRDPAKQQRATQLVRDGLAARSIRVPHQAIVEFVAATTRPLRTGGTLLTIEEARFEAEELLGIHDILYPNEALVRTAIRGSATYGLSWFDAHLWAYADHYGIEQLYSEDFQHERHYGTVQAVNPFL